MRNYWAYRIDNSRIEFFQKELEAGHLRQGWGWDKGQDLRDMTMNEGARRNMPMFNKVKKGDILLIPRIPSWGEVTIAEATEDWSNGYNFEIYEKFGDYGHIFPAKIISRFNRHNKNVTGNIRSTLKNPSRFWNMNHYSDDVEKLLEKPINELSESQNREDRLFTSIKNVFNDVFDDSVFKNKVYDKLNEQFTREEWEFALIAGLNKIFPFYKIERVAGKEEKEHGTDILIRIPGPLSDYEYGIAIQVKDYEGSVGDKVIEQINKSEKYWNSESFKIIEKIVIITKAKRAINTELETNESDVKFIFAGDLMDLLNKIARTSIGIKDE